MTQKSQVELKHSFTLVEIVAGCVIRKDGKYLLVQEKKPKAYGLWSLPAGRVNKGETIRQAAIRETKEEVGLDVHIGRPLLLTHENATTPVKHSFMAQIIGSSPMTLSSDELLDAKWLTYQEVNELRKRGKLRTAWVWDSITKVESSGE